MKSNPPKLPLRFFRWFCHPKLRDNIEGDLMELYEERKIKCGKLKADAHFIKDVLLLFRPGIIKPTEGTQTLNTYGMYNSYFKVGWRNLLRNKGYAGINIAGLALGMAVALLIGLWTWDEVSFDKVDREDYSSIAQVIQHVTNNGEVQTWTAVPYPLAEALRTSYSSDFDYVVLGTRSHDYLLTVNDKILTQTGAWFEPMAPHLFTLPMLQGTRNSLKNSHSIIISRSLAQACFGNEMPLGKTIRIGDTMEMAVTGVYDDFPSNSTFAGLQFIGTWEQFSKEGGWVENMQNPWRPNAFNVYVKLSEPTSLAQVSEKIQEEKIKHLTADLAKQNPQLLLWPMRDWHLYADFKNGENVGGRIQYVWTFGIIGVFVLLLACINFMNLCTARSERRAKEIGVRKSIGSVRSQLIAQFFSESFLLVFIALVFALIIAYLALPFFNVLADKTIFIPWFRMEFWSVAVIFCLFTGVVAGSYPAFYLSAFHPVRVLKGTFRATGGTTVFRRSLVVVQFSISIILIIGTLVVYRQIEHGRNRSTGYETSGVISVHTMNDKVHNAFNVFTNELIQAGAIVSASEASTAPTSIWATSSGFSWEGKDPAQAIDFPFLNISKDFGKTIGWQVTQGRDFSDEFASDTSALILNEAAVLFMNLKDPIGATIRWFDSPYRVIGVVKDLIMQSPYEPVRPTVFALGTGVQNMLIVKLSPQMSMTTALTKVEDTFKKINPTQPFEYQFLDEEYARKFGSEARVGKLAFAFAGLAIAISCLGIFGLAAFVAEQRTKEIGIRKILGASTGHIWKLISKEFVLLVILSCIVALPVGYYATDRWLLDFTYRTNLAWWIFALSFAGALMITLLTVSTQAIKAALMNPVKSLRSE